MEQNKGSAEIKDSSIPDQVERRPADAFVGYFGLECIVQFRQPVLLCQAKSKVARELPVLGAMGMPIPTPDHKTVLMHKNWPIKGQCTEEGTVYVVTLDGAVIGPSLDRSRVCVMYVIDGDTMQMSVDPSDIIAVTKVGAVTEESMLVKPGI